MPLAPRTRLGPYEVLAPLGAGGMGEVYRARDTRLGRSVAVKVLPLQLTSTPEARARFEREARTISQLNHPHICTVHDVGREGDIEYLVMEIVEGESLAHLIALGALPAELVLRYGAQIADALAYAHEHGVIHRDLKGSNVVVTPDGRGKVLDFGIARLKGAGDSEPASQAGPTLTEPGSVVGTPHYLAPEVLRGGRGDERSDIWALGVLLHEMASSALPFSGRTGHELSAAILNDSPAPLPARVSPGLRTVIQRCLAKEPGQRFGNAGELRAALQALQSATSVPPMVRPAGRGRLAPRVALGLTLAVILAAAAWLSLQQPWRAKELKQRQLTSNPAENPVGYGVISPDGKTLAVVDQNGLSLRAISSGESNTLKIPAEFSLGGYPFQLVSWYPDGNQLLMSGKAPDGEPYVWSLPVLGGRARKIIVGGSVPTISRDGSHIAYVRQGKGGNDIWCSGPNGEEPRLVASSDSSGMISTWGTWSPSGRRLAFQRVSMGPRGTEVRLESSDLKGNRRIAYSSTPEQRLHPLGVLLWLSDGRLLVGVSDPPPSQGDMNLWSLRVDPNSGQSSGKLSRVTQWQRLSLVGATGVSADGRRISVGVMQYQSDCYVGTLARDEPGLRDVRRLTLDDRFDIEPSWLPDGKAILFSSDRNGSVDIFRQPLDAADAEPVVTGPGNQQQPCVSPDGNWILFKEGGSGQVSGTGATRIMRMPVGGGPPEKVLDTQGAASISCGDRAGSMCVLSELAGEQIVFTAFDPVRGRGESVARMKAGQITPWGLSPDGSTLAVVEQQDSLPSIHLIRTHGGSTRDVRLDRKIGIMNIAWAADGGHWFVVGKSAGVGWRLLRVDPDGRTTDLIPPQPWMYSAAASPDGRHIAYTSNTVDGNIWLLEDF